MKKLLLLAFLMAFTVCEAKKQQQVWPDGTPISEWFNDTTRVDVNTLGTRYVLTDHGVSTDTTLIQTAQIQAVIDLAAKNGGGVVVVPHGLFKSGALFFRPKTHLHLEEGAMLKGSDRIADYPIAMTRIEGETCKYFTALINADRVDGFTITGTGTIDGNGAHYWREFWIRRQWNPKCTNKDAQRPRLTYISNSKNVTVQDVHLQNSPFWTNHVYNSDHVRFLYCKIYAPTEGLKAPSSDAIDLDVCHDVLVHRCYMNVNDDAVVLKGGKGTFADKDSTNGSNYNIIVQDCHYGTVHGCLTAGSEALFNHNIIMRRCHADSTYNVLWLKMRPDTPQHYEYIRVEDFTGKCRSFLLVKPWTQFYNKVEREDMPLSQCNNIQLVNIRMECGNFFDVRTSDKYALKDFSFENIDVLDEKDQFDATLIPGTTAKKIKINGKNR